MLEHGERIDYGAPGGEDLHPGDVELRWPLVDRAAELAVTVFEIVFDVELNIP
ncbi:MAG TPA: hypothetical protein VLG15_08375 [Thermoanaerobaculia bacterium]|nr:hypothetical protein [Thermoanaerobaculia bacterium]